MKNVGLKSAYKIRVDVLDLGIFSMVPNSKNKSYDKEVIH